MQCKVTCFIIAVDCSDFGYVCFALLDVYKRQDLFLEAFTDHDAV